MANATPPSADVPADPQALARGCARLMYEDDRAARHLGIEIVDIGPGTSRLRMSVRPEFTNGHGLCHGGYIFLLADTAFAYACNSRNQRAVAAAAAIDFVAPGAAADVLTAEATEQHLGGRSGVYDIRVTRQDGTLIALFRGRSASIKGTFFGASA